MKARLRLPVKPHKGHFTSKLKYRRFPSYLLCALLLLPFHLLLSPVHPTGFQFCFLPCFLAIFILLSSKNVKVILRDQNQAGQLPRIKRKAIYHNQTGKTTAIRRTAVRKTVVSRNHGGPIEGVLKPLNQLKHYCIERFKGRP